MSGRSDPPPLTDDELDAISRVLTNDPSGDHRWIANENVSALVAEIRRLRELRRLPRCPNCDGIMLTPEQLANGVARLAALEVEEQVAASSEAPAKAAKGENDEPGN